MVSKQKKPRAVGKGSHSLLKGPKPLSTKHSKPGKLPSVKNKIRGLQRLLRKAGTDHKMKRNFENKLAELQSSLARHDKEALERKYAVRYHKIRFFERVKLERRAKQLDSKAERCHALSGDELQSLQQIQQDLQYVIHFPKGERYVSILKQAADPAAQAQLESERTRLMGLVQHQLAQRALLADADEGLGKAFHHEDQHAEQAGADAFFLESDDSDAAQTSAETQPAKPWLENPVSAATDAKALQAQQQSAHEAPVAKYQQKRQHDRLRQPKASANEVKHRHSSADEIACDTSQDLSQPVLSRPQTANTAADSSGGVAKGFSKANSQAQQLYTVIQPSADVPAEIAVPQAVTAVRKGFGKATSGHIKSQALLHQLKQKHLVQHRQARLQLPANLHQVPAQSRTHKVEANQHAPSVNKDVQRQDASAAVKAPVRTRAQGGRKRRK